MKKADPIFLRLLRLDERSVRYDGDNRLTAAPGGIAYQSVIFIASHWK
jgi:hypothetical protein